MDQNELALALEEKRAEMLRIAQSLLRAHGREADAEDFLQDSFIKLLDYQDSLTPDNIGAFVQRTLVHLIYDSVAKDRTQTTVTDEYTRTYQPDSQAQIQQRERIKADAGLALDLLEPETRETVRLVWMDDETWEQAAKTQRCSKRDIHARVTEALPILQTSLARYDHRPRPTQILIPRPYTTAQRKGMAASLRSDRRVRQPGPITITVYGPDGAVMSRTIESVSQFRKRVSASQAPYKEETVRRFQDTAPPSGGLLLGGDASGETAANEMAPGGFAV